MQIFHLILILVVGKTSASSETFTQCTARAVIPQPFCDYFKSHLKHVDGDLGEVLCGCFAGLSLAMEAKCDIDYGVDEKAAPACFELVRSGTYHKFFAHDKVGDLICKITRTRIVNIREKNKAIQQKSVATIFKTGAISKRIEAAITKELPSDQAKPLILCYQQIRKLITG